MKTEALDMSLVKLFKDVSTADTLTDFERWIVNAIDLEASRDTYRQLKLFLDYRRDPYKAKHLSETRRAVSKYLDPHILD